ncbi:VanZ family protein [bacterium]|nr:VanZ family protein [bacterium]
MALRLMMLVFVALLPGFTFAQVPAADSSVVKRVQRASDSWFGKDKADHLTLSAALTAAQYYALHREANMSSRRSLQTAVASTALIGVAKEIYDATARKRFASKKDLAADVLGIALAVILIHK